MNWSARGGLGTLAVPLIVLFGAIALVVVGAGTANGHVVWFAARASGLTAYALATASVLFGLASASRAGNPKPGLGFVADVHRALSLLTLVAIGGHVFFLALDSYANFGPLDLFVPFASWYRPTWTGLGVLAGYLSVAVFISFYIRTWIGYRAWRVFHYAAFGVFGLGTIHGVLAGTDSSTLPASTIYAGAIASVALMGAYRLLRGSGHQPAWAFDESSGNLGATRAVLAVAVLFAALVLPLWVFNQATASAPPTAQPGAAAATASSSGGENGAATGDSGAVQEQEQQQEEDGSSARLAFVGSVQGSGSWRLLSATTPALELDLSSAGVLSLRDPDSGQVLFQSQRHISASGASGQLQSLMDGQGRYQGYTLAIDGSYRLSAGRVQLTAQLAILNGVVQSGE
jgi:sulfoxide reductase heme-binding subunit YedZ